MSVLSDHDERQARLDRQAHQRQCRITVPGGEAAEEAAATAIRLLIPFKAVPKASGLWFDFTVHEDDMMPLVMSTRALDTLRLGLMLQVERLL